MSEKLSIEIPVLNYKVQDKLVYNGTKVWVSDIMFSMADFNWYAFLFEIDDNEIIQKTTTVPAKLLNEATKCS